MPVTRRERTLRLGVLAVVLGFVLSNFDGTSAQSSAKPDQTAQRASEIQNAQTLPGVVAHLHGDEVHYHVVAPATDATTADTGRARSHKRLGKKARGLVFKGLRRVHRKNHPCRGGFTVEADHTEACTHGPDAAPPGVDVRVRPTTAELRENTSQSASQSSSDALPCYGDGSSGDRVQAIYAHSSDVSDRFGEIAPYIPTWAARVDATFAQSAAETGGSRHVRWVTNPDCTLAVQSVQLSPSGDDSLTNTINELRSMGYSRSDRKYLVWADATRYCGIGEILGDDRPDAGNSNNFGPSFARVDSSCWGMGDSVEAHELMHTMGGTQLSAPHSSGGWHCLDENDRMCLADNSQALSFPCASTHESLFDCGHDDYFSTAPPAGSYLATHWNVANSSYLSADMPESCSKANQTTSTHRRHRHRGHGKARAGDSSAPCVPAEAFT